jgi:hypothetical protein
MAQGSSPGFDAAWSSASDFRWTVSVTCAHGNQRTAIRVIDDVRRRLPFRIHVIQTDNGAEFSRSFTGTSRAWISAMSTSAPEPRI